MWPFDLLKTKAAPQRTVPTIPFVDAQRWAAGMGTSNAYVTPQKAESLAALSACVSLISESVGSLPAQIVTNDANATPQPNHPVAKLIAEPNSNDTWTDLIVAWLSSTLLYGNGLLEIAAGRAGVAEALRPVRWPTVAPFQEAQSGALLFDIVPMDQPGAGKRRTLIPGEYLLLKDRTDCGPLGVSRLQRSALALQLAMGVQSSAYVWQSNAARPSGYIRSPNKVSEELAKRIRDAWNEAYNNQNTGKAAILPDNMEWLSLSLMSADDAQLVERLAYGVRDVARLYNVPSFMLADETRSTFASASAALQMFSRSLVPWVTRIESVFSAALLEPGFKLQIDLGALLRSDPAATSESMLKLRMAGALSPNDVRAELGYPASSDPLANSLLPPSVVPAAVSSGTKPPANDDGEPDPVKGMDAGAVRRLIERRMGVTLRP